MNSSTIFMRPPNHNIIAPAHQTTQEVISSGTYGSVKFDSYNSTIAIKECGREVFYSSIRETSVMNFLNHPNIIKPLNIKFSEKGDCKIYMERYKGNFHGYDWLKHSKNIKRAPITSLIRILGELSSAIDYMHKRGIIHADLKPANILFDVVREPENNFRSYSADACISANAKSDPMHSGSINARNLIITNRWKIKPIICDFNISIINNSPSTNTLLQTLNFRAPEVDCNFGNTGNLLECSVSEKIDIWSFGCIVFELFTGEMFIRPESGDLPSWFICARKFLKGEHVNNILNDCASVIANADTNAITDMGADTPTQRDAIDYIKSELFCMKDEDVSEVINTALRRTNWRSHMRLDGPRGMQASEPFFNIFSTIMIKCLHPHPDKRWSSEELFEFMRGVCVDSIDVSVSPVIADCTPIPIEKPKFTETFFLTVIEEKINALTIYSADSASGNGATNASIAQRANKHKILTAFINQYPHLYLMSAVIESRYYIKKGSNRIIGSDSALNISIACAIISCTLLDYTDALKEIRKLKPSENYVFEIATELGGNFI